jgi:hypothetical protein
MNSMLKFKKKIRFEFEVNHEISRLPWKSCQINELFFRFWENREKGKKSFFRLNSFRHSKE